MILKSICKINIGLNIVARREDGYHLIESIFYPVSSLFDLVEVVVSDGADVQFSQSGIVVDCPADDNLCVKAYRAFRDVYDVGSVRIHLHKMIPFGAGIGGGSANAATVIRLLNQIFSVGASAEELCVIAANVGSDVPFFIYNKPLMVRGTGNIFSHISLDLTGKHITIVKPDFGVSTKEAYSRITPSQPLLSIEEVVASDWRGLSNDFEPVICNERMLQIKSELLNLGADYVSMSGSGSAIYALSDEVLDISGLFEGEFTHQGVL